ncbi:MAG TPA: proteasome assembly chaperone family protein [Candidatus Syntrophoarchaeum butanivorans]|uniref:Proteasome assembly chaperone family protein n=1 Tax=Candidatus Syntropharchaeum butanivorans TaxID=1839936 RepID=A0A1F2P574_9EURY|nr:MAG: Conserved hypothetical protein CHP00062 [Candidatus Syntrophoarchaeum butanivorans]HDM36842.1 proteasome assembly chaperone family protein [Candidatus Syntrophoarchaeum butanivorans]HEC57187.1 proteasome assembly chaperone family protein [Candidatus Syntrophoarchaeum butanivorans]
MFKDEFLRHTRIAITYRVEKPVMEDPIFIEGLSGLGNVGLIAASHLIRSIGAEKLADVYSPYFLRPGMFIPGIMYTDGVAELPKDEIYYDTERNLLIILGFYQGSTPNSYFRLADRLLDFCEEFGVKRIFTLGGYGTGQYHESPSVHGVATSPELVEMIKKHGAIVEPGTGGPVTGISGLLLGLGKERGFEGICLLGETFGEFPDPKAAKAVLDVLCSIIGIEVDTSELEKEIEVIEGEIHRRAMMIKDQIEEEEAAKRDDLSYIC